MASRGVSLGHVSELYTPDQVAERLAITRKQVMLKVAKREWPHLRISPHVTRFTEEHIAQIISLCEIRPTPEVANPWGRVVRGRR